MIWVRSHPLHIATFWVRTKALVCRLQQLFVRGASVNQMEKESSVETKKILLIDWTHTKDKANQMLHYYDTSYTAVAVFVTVNSMRSCQRDETGVSFL